MAGDSQEDSKGQETTLHQLHLTRYCFAKEKKLVPYSFKNDFPKCITAELDKAEKNLPRRVSERQNGES